jgi:predicted transcriptional regulator YheO
LVPKNLIYVFKNTGRQVDKPVCSIRLDVYQSFQYNRYVCGNQGLLGRQTGCVAKNLIYVYKNTGRQVDKPVGLICLDVSVEIRVDRVDRPVGSLKI